MKRTLIYHLYCGEDFSTNFANAVHFHCLKKYAKVFDEVKFTIAVDDINNDDLVTQAISWIYSIGFKGKKTITTAVNTPYYEVETFNSEFLKRYNDLDGMVFFAHNKGTTNIVRDGMLNMNVARWICGMYFYNLEFLDEVEGIFTGTKRAPDVFYGTFLQYFSKERQSMVHAMPNNKSGLIYSGTFYWINIPKYKNCVEMGTVKHVEPDSRFFAEEYPGMFFERYAYGCGMTSHNDAILDAIRFNIYNLNEDDWGAVLNILGEKEKYVEFSNNIVTTVFK